MGFYGCCLNRLNRFKGFSRLFLGFCGGFVGFS